MEDQRNNQVSEPERGDLTSLQSRAMITGAKLILASASPRRAEILRTVGWPFEQLPVDIDESRRLGEEAAAYVERVARGKAEAAASRVPRETILGADTVVVVENEVLGKPRDDEDARRMLRLLRDRWHRVLTGVALVNGEAGSTKVAHEVTEVRFAAMTENEISWYVATGEPKGKAGAYAIQGQGARFIKEIRGDYFNVVGLPVRLLYELLNESK